MNTNEIRLKIAALEAHQRRASVADKPQIEDELRGLKNRLTNTIATQDKRRRMAVVAPLITQAAVALREKEISAEEQRRLAFQVGQREAARAAFMAANGGSDVGFDTAWQEIQTDLAKAAAKTAAAQYDPDGTKSAVVGAVLAKYSGRAN